MATARTAAGLTQEDLAAALRVERSTVVRWEAGRHAPQSYLWPELARCLQVSTRELGELLTEIDASTAESRGPSTSEVRGAPSAVALVDAVPSLAVLDVLGPAHTLVVVDDFTRSVVARYEVEGPHRLAPEVSSLRRLCQELGSRVSGTDERQHLVRVSARQSALLAYMSVNLGRYTDAEHYALEASMLATAAQDRPLLAWIKATQSFAAYYQERYQDALTLARVGIQLAGEDAQRIRLLSNGVARAAGKLGDRYTVDHAINTAFELLDKATGPVGMTPCIDFQPYGWARTAANAATAYLAGGDYVRALRLTQELGTVVAACESDWSRSLVRLDEATALTLGQDADVEHAASLGIAALTASASKPITSVASRAKELATALQRHGRHRAGDEFEAALREWTRGVPGTTT
ncbi:MAG: helix-turn-helix transcriptional regulator [Sciscionella sp.]